MATYGRPGRSAIAALLVLAVGVGSAACGSENTRDTTAPKAEINADAGKLQHVDGTVRLAAGGALEVSPTRGDAVTLELGPTVEQGTVKGLAASGVRARVFYAEQEDGLVAASAAAAPTADGGLKSYEGIVLEASEDHLELGGDEGDRTFRIEPADREQFEVEHMLEHKASTEKIRVFYRPGKDGDRATAYEDA